MAHGDLHERIAAVTDQIQTNQSNPDLWLLRADLHRQHEEFDAALTDIEKADQLKPDWSATHLQSARIRFDMSNYPEAIRHATDCLKLDNANADALVIRARSYTKLEKFSEAVADYDAVLSATNGPRPLPDLFLERARAQAAIEHWDDAIHGLDAGMKRLGETPSLALPAIAYERKRGSFDAALSRLESAKSFFSEDSYKKLHAEILKQAGRQ